jgi:cyclin-dependent kinase
MLSKIGEGTYGIVHKSRVIGDGGFYAMKTIFLNNEDEGIPSTAIREIGILQDLKHENIVRLHEVIHTQNALTMVFEYMDNDVKQLLDMTEGIGFKNSKTKSLLRQLLRGLHFCHERDVLHRDLKPQNLLVCRNGTLRLADFGLARPIGIPVKSCTHEVVTLWYRAPDVLMGSTKYSQPIDIWSVGCIFAEMSNGVALMRGTEENELLTIFQILGTPQQEHWEDMYDLPSAIRTFPSFPAKSWKEICPYLPDIGRDLLSKLLVYDPNKRISAANALKHAYFED